MLAICHPYLFMVVPRYKKSIAKSICVPLSWSWKAGFTLWPSGNFTWRYPWVPLNHLFWQDFPLKTPRIWGTPIYGTPHIAMQHPPFVHDLAMINWCCSWQWATATCVCWRVYRIKICGTQNVHGMLENHCFAVGVPTNWFSPKVRVDWWNLDADCLRFETWKDRPLISNHDPDWENLKYDNDDNADYTLLMNNIWLIWTFFVELLAFGWHPDGLRSSITTYLNFSVPKSSGTW